MRHLIYSEQYDGLNVCEFKVIPWISSVLDSRIEPA